MRTLGTISACWFSPANLFASKVDSSCADIAHFTVFWFKHRNTRLNSKCEMDTKPDSHLREKNCFFVKGQVIRCRVDISWRWGGVKGKALQSDFRQINSSLHQFRGDAKWGATLMFSPAKMFPHEYEQLAGHHHPFTSEQTHEKYILSLFAQKITSRAFTSVPNNCRDCIFRTQSQDVDHEQRAVNERMRLSFAIFLNEKKIFSRTWPAVSQSCNLMGQLSTVTSTEKRRQKQT